MTSHRPGDTLLLADRYTFMTNNQDWSVTLTHLHSNHIGLDNLRQQGACLAWLKSDRLVILGQSGDTDQWLVHHQRPSETLSDPHGDRKPD